MTVRCKLYPLGVTHKHIYIKRKKVVVFFFSVIIFPSLFVLLRIITHDVVKAPKETF